MADQMLQFVSLPQRAPQKRDSSGRVADFCEINQPFAANEAESQASRCSQCGVPYCSIACPLGNNIPDWLRLAAEDRLQEAYHLAARTNSFPEICGRICPQDRLCEGNCVIAPGFESVTIGAIEKHITEKAFEHGWVTPDLPIEERSQSVGIIGAGPAGLAAAERLRAYGYQTHVYDRNEQIGGLLTFGIPSFKLEKEVIERRYQLLSSQGIKFHLSTTIGAKGDISLSALRARHDALFIGSGVYQPRTLRIPGAEKTNVVQALDFLIAENRKQYGFVQPADVARYDAFQKHVVVVGGGDTAMDCVRTALRQEAERVTCLYRRDRANMPGSAQEVRNAEEEGANFYWLAAPEAFIGTRDVTDVLACRTRFTLPDESGRRAVENIVGSQFSLKADLVILALGFEPENLPSLWEEPTLDVTTWGTIAVKEGRQATRSLSGVFAGGDIVRGASLVVWAIRDGRNAAEEMHHYLVSRNDAGNSIAAHAMAER